MAVLDTTSSAIPQTHLTNWLYWTNKDKTYYMAHNPSSVTSHKHTSFLLLTLFLVFSFRVLFLSCLHTSTTLSLRSLFFFRHTHHRSSSSSVCVLFPIPLTFHLLTAYARQNQFYLHFFFFCHFLSAFLFKRSFSRDCLRRAWQNLDWLLAFVLWFFRRMGCLHKFFLLYQEILYVHLQFNCPYDHATLLLFILVKAFSWFSSHLSQAPSSSA